MTHKNIKLLLLFLLVAIVTSFIFCMIGFTSKYDRQCKFSEDFENWQQMENDPICGDFGLRHMEAIMITGIHGVLFVMVLVAYLNKPGEDPVI